MVSKNNHTLIHHSTANRKSHYGLRKLSVGVASVLLGTTLYWGGTTALADTNAQNPTPEAAESNATGDVIQRPTVELNQELPAKAQQLSIQVTGNSAVNYGDNDWQQLVNHKTLPSSGYSVNLSNDERVELTDGDVAVDGTPGNVGSYKVVLTDQGLQDIKDQLGTDFTYPDLKDVTSSATLKIKKGYKEIILNGSAEKPYDGTNGLSTFHKQFGLGDNNADSITIYKSDGTKQTFELQPDDIVTKSKRAPINVGTYDVVLSDEFMKKVKAADGNNGNNYEWFSDPAATYKVYADDGVAKLSGQNEKIYDGHATTTAEVNGNGKIAVHVTAPVMIMGDEPGEETTEKTLDYENYTLQDGDYTWNTADGKAPTNGGTYTLTLNKDAIIDHLQAYLNQKADVGQNDQPNVTIDATGLSGQATFTIKTTNTYQFVDTENNNKPVGEPIVETGLTGQSKELSLTVPENYELIDASLPTKANFGDTNQTFTLKLKHKTTIENTLVTVSRKITINEPGKAPQVIVQTVTFHQTANTDLVTNHSTDTYDHNSLELPVVNVPTVAGYTASQSKVSALSVGPTDHPADVNITYLPNDQSGAIIYVDQSNGQQVGTTPLTGKTDEIVTINQVIPAGYQLVPGQNIPKTEVAMPNGIANVTVLVEHEKPTIKPNEPTTQPTDSTTIIKPSKVTPNKEGVTYNSQPMYDASSANVSNVVTPKHQLPQTGNNNSKQLVTLGLLSAGLASLFGLGGLRKKRNH